MSYGRCLWLYPYLITLNCHGHLSAVYHALNHQDRFVNSYLFLKIQLNDNVLMFKMMFAFLTQVGFKHMTI